LNETLKIVFYGKDANTLEENKQNFCLGNERGAFLDSSKEGI
jgi:hypothetical protein